MAKRTKNGVRSIVPTTEALPEWMREEEDLGTEEVVKYIVPARLKVIQRASDDEPIKKFGIGSVIMSSTQQIVAREGERFKIVPVFFYPEWATTTPITERGKLPFIIERTLNPADSIAKKAKNPNTRTEQSDQHRCEVRHVEFLNFLCVLYDHPSFKGEQVALSYAKGDHFLGTQFNGIIRQRRAPIYGCVFEAAVQPRSNAQGNWHGIVIQNPTDGPAWVTEDEYSHLKQLYLDLKKAHADMRIRVDYEDDAPVETGEATGEF